MARSHLTLAALATSAVPGFDPIRSRSFSTGAHGDFFAAVVENAAGRELLVRVPNSAEAEAQLRSELFALEHMSAGIRSRLAFDVPAVVAHAPIGKTFGLIFDFIRGSSITLADFRQDSDVPVSVGRGIAAIHALPTSFVADAALPIFHAGEVQRQTAELIARARATNLLPAALASRWQNAVDDGALWMFEATVTHGSLNTDSFLVGEDSLSAILGWAALRVGDPAWDLHWMINTDLDSQDIAFGAYSAARRSSADPKLRQRATLYSELELARWLLHGVEQKSAEIVDDAINMLDRLVDSVHSETSSPIAPRLDETLTVTQVVEMLDDTPGGAKGAQPRGGYRGMEPVTDNHRSSSSLSE
jgi:macrolide phosphotransferase